MCGGSLFSRDQKYNVYGPIGITLGIGLFHAKALKSGANKKARRPEYIHGPTCFFKIHARKSCHDTAPATRFDFSSFFSFNSVSITSVVSASAETLAAFCRAVVATLAGSITPILNMSPYSPVAAL